MKIVLGVPVIDQHKYAEALVKILIATVKDRDNFTLVLIDNGSKTPYIVPQGHLPFKIDVITNKENKGYYYPLKQLYDKYKDAGLIGLMHNDVHIYEVGWDNKVREYFKADKKLGLVGLYGSRTVDKKYWDADPVGHFSDPQHHKTFKVKKVTKLTPVLTVDSLFMLFRKEVISLLQIDQDITLCHFYDKIWPMRVIENGYKVACLGIKYMHESNVTSTMQQYFESAQKWWAKRGVAINVESADFLMRFSGMLRYRIEYADIKKMIPATIDNNYNIKKL